MGKFRQISTELWPLIDVSISLPIFFILCMKVDIGKECLGIANGYILTNKYRALNDVQNCVLLNRF